MQKQKILQKSYKNLIKNRMKNHTIMFFHMLQTFQILEKKFVAVGRGHDL